MERTWNGMGPAGYRGAFLSGVRPLCASGWAHVIGTVSLRAPEIHRSGSDLMPRGREVVAACRSRDQGHWHAVDVIAFPFEMSRTEYWRGLLLLLMYRSLKQVSDLVLQHSLATVPKQVVIWDEPGADPEPDPALADAEAEALEGEEFEELVAEAEA